MTAHAHRPTTCAVAQRALLLLGCHSSWHRAATTTAAVASSAGWHRRCDDPRPWWRRVADGTRARRQGCAKVAPHDARVAQVDLQRVSPSQRTSCLDEGLGLGLLMAHTHGTHTRQHTHQNVSTHAHTRQHTRQHAA